MFINQPIPGAGSFDFISPSVPRSKNVTFQRYHKIKMDSLRSDMANYLFVKGPGNTASVLYK